MLEILTFAFFQRALVLLILMSIVAGIVGSLIVVKKISLMGGSISHGAFGGLGIAYFFGISPVAGAIVFSLVGAIVIGYVRRSYRYLLDSTLSLFWAGGIAIGLIFLALTPGYVADLYSYLFGNLLLNSNSDLVFAGAITVLVLVVFLMLRETLVITFFDEEFARTKKIPTNLVFTIFLVIAALSIVMLIQTIGVILTLAVLTIPPGLAWHFSDNLVEMILISLLINLITGVAGLFIAYWLDIATSPIIVVSQVLVFVVGISISKLNDIYKQKC